MSDAATPTRIIRKKTGNYLEDFEPDQIFRHKGGKTITDGLFATVQHVGDRGRIDALLRQQGAHGHDRRRFAGEVFQQHIGRQR